ncbi:MAG TPA: hypothetical protein VGM88_06805 [Kofleriaceae bacterium]|jgi:hypothetical protein
MRSYLFALLALAACGDDASKHVDAPRADAAHDTAPPVDATPDAPADQVVTLAGGANALLWDASTSTLFLTNDTAGTLQTWTAAAGVVDYATFPAESAGLSLGGIVKQANGTILVANFGFGSQGTLFAVGTDANHTVTPWTGLDSTRKRIGIAQQGTALYTSYFTGTTANAVGGVASVTVAGTVGTETEIAGVSTATTFGKIVGLVADADALYASDQTGGKIFKVALPGGTVTTLATITKPTKPDLIMELPNGDLLMGGGSTITRITKAGVVSTLANTGFDTVRGVAYDPAGHRLFVIDHSSQAGSPDKLHIQPFGG